MSEHNQIHEMGCGSNRLCFDIQMYEDAAQVKETHFTMLLKKAVSFVLNHHMLFKYMYRFKGTTGTGAVSL